MQNKCPFCQAQNNPGATQCAECQRALIPGPQLIPPVLYNPPPPVGNPPFIRPAPPVIRPTAPPIVALAVDVFEGGQPTQTHHFEKTEIIVGRVGTDVILNKGNVSKRHCRIFVQDNLIYIEDLKTTNGTEVNGKKITQPEQISSGNNVYISDFILQVRPAPSAPPVLLPPNPPFIPNLRTNPPFVQTPPVVEPATPYHFEVLVRNNANGDPEKLFRVTKPELTIGRGANVNDVVISSSVLSRRHMQVVVRQNRVFVEDLRSTNGITIQGRRITEPHPITSIDKFSVNEFDLWVRVSGPRFPEQPPLPMGPGLPCTIEARDSQGGYTRRTFQQPHIIVGRDTNLDLVLMSNMISKRHACIIAEADGFSIFDLESVNGVKLPGDARKHPWLKTSGQSSMIELGDLTLTLTLGHTAAPVAPPNKDIIAGDAFFFVLDSFLQAASHRWIASCFGAEQIERVLPFARGELEIPGAPSRGISPEPKKLVLPNSAVLLPGRFLQRAGPPDPVQLKPLHDKALQLQIVQPMQHVVVLVSDRSVPTPRANPTPDTAYENDALYQVAKKFFAQGKLVEARAVFEEARLALAPHPPQIARDIALCELRLANHRSALHWLAVALEDGYEKKALRAEGELAPLRELPDFQRLFVESKREYRFTALHPGDTLQIERFQATNMLVGAFVGGEPWESLVSL